MTRIWKATVVMSISLNLACFVGIAVLPDALVDAQSKNLMLFRHLSFDQQSLRRELNAAAERFNVELR